MNKDPVSRQKHRNLEIADELKKKTTQNESQAERHVVCFRSFTISVEYLRVFTSLTEEFVI